MDIDIDFKTTFDPRDIIKSAVPASRVSKGKLLKHQCGHYFQDIPVDKYTGFAAIPFEEAEVLGYFKIDFLHLGVLNNFESKKEIRALIKKDPDWNLLLDASHVAKLFHIKNNPDMLKKIRPRSVQELADCLALIRPGKNRLVAQYINDPDGTREELYTKSADDKYAFKRAHAIAYALTIVLELHLIGAGVL